MNRVAIVIIASMAASGCGGDDGPRKPTGFEIDSPRCVNAGGVPIRDMWNGSMMTDCLFNNAKGG